MGNSCPFFMYADGFVHNELSGDERERFGEHLLSCPVCNTEVQKLESVRESLEAAYTVRLDAQFNYSVLRSLREKKSNSPIGEIKIAVEDILISLATLVAIALLSIQFFGTPRVSSVEMVGRLTNIERSSIEQTSLSNDQVLELVLRSR